MKITNHVLSLLLALAAAGCASYKPQDIRAGQSEAELLQLMGQPTGRYPGPNGQSRIEFATGPYGRVTWMVDVDAGGKVLVWGQVLNETAFRYVQQNFQGQDKDWLRYTTTECFWFQVSVQDDGKLRDGGAIGIDPRCDPGSFGGASWGR
jgi:hypothetical protein